MRMHVAMVGLVAAVAVALGCGGSPDPDDPINPGAPDGAPGSDAEPTPDAGPGPASIDEFLDNVPGLDWTEIDTEYSGYRAFAIAFDQPIDHSEPGGRGFDQRLVLHHRDAAAPMILYTSGYSLFSFDYLSELAVALGANQISTEQRFFAASKPADIATADWTHVTIEQAASDHHRLVEALDDYYDKAWLSTGHSKGGMTSIYHRRFFPDDVDATVAYVAPISFGAPDDGYLPFFATVADADCRGALRAFQLETLTRFDAMFARAAPLAAGQSFARSGGHAAAFEGALAGMEWSFWQYASDQFCPSIPSVTGTDDQLLDFATSIVGVGTADGFLDAVDTYYYQAMFQLGFPSSPRAHLDGLLDHGAAGDYLPATAPVPTYDVSAMVDIDAWVRADADGLLFVYGEFDPWYAGAFAVGSNADSELLVAPRRNHGALIADLGSADRARALDAIERWTGVRPSLQTFASQPLRRPFIPRLPPPSLLAQPASVTLGRGQTRPARNPGALRNVARGATGRTNDRLVRESSRAGRNHSLPAREAGVSSLASP